MAVRLGETRIDSPLDGVVVQRRLDPGALVGPTAGTGSILTVARIDIIRVFIPVNERQVQLIQVGQQAHVELESAQGKSFTGEVVRVTPMLDPSTVRVNGSSIGVTRTTSPVKLFPWADSSSTCACWPTWISCTWRSFTGMNTRMMSIRATVRMEPVPAVGPTRAPGSSRRWTTTPSKGESIRVSPSRTAIPAACDLAGATVASAAAAASTAYRNPRRD